MESTADVPKLFGFGFVEAASCMLRLNGPLLVLSLLRPAGSVPAQIEPHVRTPVAFVTASMGQ